MSNERVKAALDRVLTWPQERQNDVVALLEMMEEQDRSPFRLTDEQAEEVRRRRADPQRKLVSCDEARERIGRLISPRESGTEQ
jgi:hypothetical protein